LDRDHWSGQNGRGRSGRPVRRPARGCALSPPRWRGGTT
jgi:hypothetical protein